MFQLSSANISNMFMVLELCEGFRLANFSYSLTVCILSGDMRF